MKRLTEPLANHTWLKIGGPAEIVIPESKAEFVEVLRECHHENRSYRILGNGSNLLVTDEGIDDLVIKNTEACTEIDVEETKVTVGSSVMMPQFVNTCAEHSLGGYEYLYSVPGTVGGGLYMNAGRGEIHNLTISDYLVDVEIFDGDSVRTVAKGELSFSHRFSTFQERDEWTILSATFDLPRQPREEGLEKIQERMELVSKRERGKPTAGSVYKKARLPLHKVPPNGLKIGGARFVQQKRICNDGDATFKDVKRLLTLGLWLHKLTPFINTPEVELVIWE